jgi:hypothetical protein
LIAVHLHLSVSPVIILLTLIFIKSIIWIHILLIAGPSQYT